MKKISLLLLLIAVILLVFRYTKNSEELEIDDSSSEAEQLKIEESPVIKKRVVLKAPYEKRSIVTNSPPHPRKIILTQKPIKSSVKRRYPKAVGEDFAPFDAEGNMIITEVMQDGDVLIVHGDVLVGSYEEFMRNDRDKKPLKMARSKSWPDGIIPYEIENGLPNTKYIENAIAILNSKTNATFRAKKSSEKDFVVFKAGQNNCYAHVGRIGGRQHILLSPQCREREILHEMLHTLGFIHEQNREDRDQYVEVQWHNIEDRFHSQFKKIPNHFLRVEDTPFDFKSLMLYPPSAYSRYPDDFSITNIEGDPYPMNPGELSSWDISRINNLYPNIVKD